MKATARFAWLVLLEPERSTFLEALRARVSPEQFERVQAMTEAFPELLALLDQNGMSLARLRRVAFGAPTEKTDTVCPPTGPASEAKPRRKRKGHGRHGAPSYTGARHVSVRHPTLKPGDLCPGCGKGKLRRQPKPAPAIRVEAQPPVTATVFEREVLRCGLCGKTFTAPAPPEAGTQKYDPSVGVMVGQLRYGSGMPFYLRLDRGVRATRRVFLRTIAPRVPRAGPASIGHIVRRTMAKAGVERPMQIAAHLFRHTLASRMLHQGADLREIAQVLRHRALISTEIYAKIDMGALQKVVRPGPAKGGAR